MSPEMLLHYPGDQSCLDVVCSGYHDSIGLYRRCSPAQRRASASCLKRFGLSAEGRSAFGRVSDGVRRLVLVARALVKAPRILVLDEPCQGLDEPNRARIMAAVEQIADQGTCTVVFVTHHATEIPACITHVLGLTGGRVTRCARHRPGA